MNKITKLLLFCFVLVCSWVFAWEAGGNRVPSDYSSNQASPKLTSDGNYGFYVVSVNDMGLAFPANGIYVQHVDSTGRILWNSGGLFIGYGMTPVIQECGNGMAYVVYDAFTPTPSNLLGVHCVKIDCDGTIIWDKYVPGIAQGSLTCPNLSLDTSGGVYITGGDNVADAVSFGLYAQHLNSNGDILWSEAPTLAYYTYAFTNDEPHLRMVSDDSGGFLFSWISFDGQPGNEYDMGIYVERVAADSTISWCTPVRIRHGHSASPYESKTFYDFKLKSDGNHGAYVAWTDSFDDFTTKLFFGHVSNGAAQYNTISNYSSDNGRLDCFDFTMLNTSTTVLAWVDGSSSGNLCFDYLNSACSVLYSNPTVCTGTFKKMLPVISTTANSSFMVSWLDYRENANNPDLFVQKYAQSGISQWTQNGLEYAVSTAPKTYLVGMPDSQGGFFLSWIDYRDYLQGTGSGKNVYALRINPDGTYVPTLPCEWQNYMGDFDTRYDMTYFGYESPGTGTNMVSYSWISTYSGHNGILKLNYTSGTDGLKLTARYRFPYSEATAWHRLRVTYRFDSPCSNDAVMPTLLFYDTPSTYNLKALGGSFTGLGLVTSTTWYTFETYVMGLSLSGQMQLLFNNYGSSGAMYIDTIELTTAVPPALNSQNSIVLPGFDFNVASDTCLWAFDSTDAKPMAPFYWNPGSFLMINYENGNESIKITSRDTCETASVPSNVLMGYDIFPTKTTDQTYYETILYGEDGNPNHYEMTALYLFGVLPSFAASHLQVSYASPSGAKRFRPQIITEINGWDMENDDKSTYWIYLGNVSFKYY